MLTNVNNELTTKALNLYFEINKRPDMVMFLEQIYGSICDSLEIEPEMDLDNPYSDSPNYQRSIVCETVKSILSLSEELTSELSVKLNEMLAHIEEVEHRMENLDEEDSLDLEEDDEDEDEDDQDDEDVEVEDDEDEE
jgi:hypothetical protein